jgi:DNA-directed RNA polymerase subunit M/transcription elongation factor TFIIS
MACEHSMGDNVQDSSTDRPTCPRCHATLTTLRQPTTMAAVPSEPAYRCLHCGWLGDEQDRTSEAEG